MSLISQLLPRSNVALDIDAGSKKRVFEHAGQLFELNQGIEHSLIFDSLFARERLGSTGLGHGVAIPHGRIKGLEHAAGAFLRLAAPIDFDAPDGETVSLVFVLLVPEQANETHLQLLAELAQLFSDRDFRDALHSAADADSAHQLFLNWSTEHH
ncbi:MAG: PTS IIA-like nitrogen regulatory protein PtsN [Thauera sp.]|jgi:PTS system nitrogen regulatory IIA component|nr:PTS IIA-like nitrogen regulatory protein PtsN [Thauera sp.]